MRKASLLLCTLCVASFLVTVAHAEEFTFNTSDNEFNLGVKNQGWWSDVDPGDPAFGRNYLVGRFVGTPPFTLTGPTAIYRDFFTFNLSSLAGQIIEVTSATLELTRDQYNSFKPSEVLSFFEVTTPAATLNNLVGTNASIFTDLGDGDAYGTFTVNAWGDTGPDKSAIASFKLNSSAVGDINAVWSGQRPSSGGYFSIGGDLQSINPSSTEQQTLFGSHFDFDITTDVQRLVIEATPVPEPSTWMLFGSGLFVLAILGWHKRLLSFGASGKAS